MGKSHPFFVLSMAPAELDAAGRATTLESLAASHVRKILATHVEGPYIVGGQCVGGALAYEIARQLRRLGKEVALLVLLDVPNLSSVRSCDTLGAKKLNYSRYLVRRVSQAGLWKSWLYCKELAWNSVARTLAKRSTPMEINIAQQIIEAAARLYVPETYEGKVLLILASNRPPHRDFHPGWQAVVTEGLHTQHIQSHHRDLLEPQHVRDIADAVTRLIGERDRGRIVE